MATFTINHQYDDSIDVEAESFDEQGSFVVFYDSENRQVFAKQSSKIWTIQKKATS